MASAGQSAGAGPSRVTSPSSSSSLIPPGSTPSRSVRGRGRYRAGPMPAKVAVGLAPCLSGSRHRPLPRPAPHLRAAPAAPRSPCARPCSLSRRRILGDAQARPAEPSAADLLAEPAHRSAGSLTLSFGDGLCPLLLAAPLSHCAAGRCQNPVGNPAASLPARASFICITSWTRNSFPLDSYRHR